MIALAEFVFDRGVGRLVAVAGGVVALWCAWLWQHDAVVKQRAVQEVVQASSKEAEKRNARAQKAHARARQPGAAERLQRQYCRDC